MEQTFEKAELWQRTQRFVLEVYSLTEKFPADEANGLTSRLRKAAVLVAVNIADGLKSEETGKNQQAHFFGISHTLIEECRRHLMFSKYLGYENNAELTVQLEELDVLLHLYSAATSVTAF